MMTALVPSSIVARTTAAIITLSIAVGVLFAGGAVWLMHGHERDRLHSRMDELLATIDDAVSTACFVRDATLMDEIADGLLSNDVVIGVRVSSPDGWNTLRLRNGATLDNIAGQVVIGRDVASPFNEQETVCRVDLYSTAKIIRGEAWRYSSVVLFILVAQVVLIAVSVAWIVFSMITRPIKSISDALHQFEARQARHLAVPAGNEQDELGRLVGDVNALIGELGLVVDTERCLRVEREVSERRLALIFEKVNAAMFVVDRQARLQSWNPALVRTLGDPNVNPDLPALFGPHGRSILAMIRSAMKDQRAIETDLAIPRADGSTQWLELWLGPLDSEHLQGVINDISDHKRSEQSAQELAERDELTGLLNRRGLDAKLRVLFRSHRAHPSRLIALLVIDLDLFKQVNDQHGHAAGDLVLRFAAKTLQSAVRERDLVARNGGDEFVIALIGIDGSEAAMGVAETIIRSITQPIDIGAGQSVRIGASIGVALFSSRDPSCSATMRRADAAMYRAKQAGRHCAMLAEADREADHEAEPSRSGETS